MTRKIIGWLLVALAMCNFLVNFVKASADNPDAFKDIWMGIAFLAIGIILLTSRKRESSGPPPEEL